MSSYLEHVFTARPDAKERIPASFDAISALVDVAVALGTAQPVLILCWAKEGGESMANDQEQASARWLFLPSSHLSYVFSTLAILRKLFPIPVLGKQDHTLDFW